MTHFLFYGLAGLILATAFLTIVSRNLFHCALYLAAAMFGVSGIFLYLNSEFLAAVQVLIYVGAVTVLVIFGISLTRNVMIPGTRVMNRQVVLSLAAAVATVWIVIKGISHSVFTGGTLPPAAATSPAEVLTDVYSLGPALLKPENGFAFAFELVSILLLSALVGAIVIARKDPE